MTLEQQVASLDLSKRLKELGVKQESLFWWHEDEMNKFIPMFGGIMLESVICSAFTVAELGEMLPKGIVSGRIHPVNLVYKGNYICYKATNAQLAACSFYADTEADVRAKMFIYLLENKLI